jgi:two-component system phosphate regulon sensor histidine kinase PhoR
MKDHRRFSTWQMLRRMNLLTSIPIAPWPASVRNRILLCLLGLGAFSHGIVVFSDKPPIGVALLVFALGCYGILEFFLSRRFDRLMQIVRRGVIDHERFQPGAFSGQDEMSRLGRAILEMASNHRRTTLAANDRTRQLDELFSAIGEGVLIVDLSGLIIRMNHTMRRWTGWYGESEGRRLYEIVKSVEISRAVSELSARLNRALPDLASVVQHSTTGDDTPSWSPLFPNSTNMRPELTEQLLLDFEPVVIEKASIEGPEARIVRVKIVPIRDTLREGVTLLIYMLDVTEVQHREQLRREFFANVSHELKTPIASIRGYAEVLRDLRSAVDENRLQAFLEVIQRNADELTKLIDEMVMISKIESGQLPLEIQSYDLKGGIAKVFETCLPKARNAHVELQYDVHDSAAFIPADPARFDSVLLNLVDNAIKYNRPGGYVKVSGRRTGEDYRIYVEDTGIGIPTEAANRIFERFYRVDKSHTRLGGGTGLGLAIVKHIVRAHGGQISVNSELSSGTVFRVTIPAKTVARRIDSRTPL